MPTACPADQAALQHDSSANTSEYFNLVAWYLLPAHTQMGSLPDGLSCPELPSVAQQMLSRLNLITADMNAVHEELCTAVEDANVGPGMRLLQGCESGLEIGPAETAFGR